MNLHLDLQLATLSADIPEPALLEKWLKLALCERLEESELTIRIVDREESRQLNHDYRGKDRPTNVLSFPFEAPPGIALNLLGDLVICAPVVEQEASDQGKKLGDHWAHMVIHGTLHLLGHDHIDDQDAAQMEALEIALLAQLNIPNPYEIR